MIDKITAEIVSTSQNLINPDCLQEFQVIVSSILGKYDITEKEEAIVPYDEKLNRGYMMFFVAKKVEGLSQKSLDYYRGEIDKFRDFIAKPLDKITTDDVRYYLAIKQLHDGVSETTADNIRRVLNCFFSWLNSEDYVPKNPVYPIKSIKHKKAVKHAFTDSEVEKLKEVCLTSKNPLKKKRDIALIETLLSTGCRVGEISTMKIREIDFSNRSIVVEGKGKKERRVFFNDKAMMRIQDYLTERNGEGDEYLFDSCQRPYKRLEKGGVEVLIRSIGAAVGIDDCYPHKFRRTAATTALRRGMSLTDIQRMLGHENLDTTRIYLDLDDSSLEAQHRKFM